MTGIKAQIMMSNFLLITFAIKECTLINIANMNFDTVIFK